MLISSFTDSFSFISITELNPMLGISHLIDGYQPRIQFIQGYTILLTKLAGLKKKKNNKIEKGPQDPDPTFDQHH